MKVSQIVAGARLIGGGRSYRRPKISIVTPTYHRNAEGLLDRCLQSAMAQTFDDFEHIIIDDGSSDGSERTIHDAALRDDRIVYLRHDSNSGLPGLRTNEGVLRARGEAIAFLFDDNVFRHDFLERAWSLLEASDVDVVHSDVLMLAKDGRDFMLGGWPLTLELLRNLNTIPNGGVLVRRSFFDRFGMYDPHLLMRRVCDWDLWLRALKLGARFRHLDDVASVEHGLVSDNSIGNTIAWDVKVVYGYMLDEGLFVERSKALTPSTIHDFDVLDPKVVRRYVRSQAEWSDFVDAVYTPFFAKHPAAFKDVLFPNNRAAALHPSEGWNPDWSPIKERRRILIVSNSINCWASMWLRQLREASGNIVINCPEWTLSAFRPKDCDLLILMDCCASFASSHIAMFRSAGVPIIYLLGFGHQSDHTHNPEFSSRAFKTNRHIAGLLGPSIYFPQSGEGFTAEQQAVAREIMANSSFVWCVGHIPEWIGLEHVRSIPLPFPAADYVEPSVVGAPQIAYSIDGAGGGRYREQLLAPSSASRADGASAQISWESVGAVADRWPGSQIVVQPDLLLSEPVAERVGRHYIQTRQGVRVVGEGQGPDGEIAHQAGSLTQASDDPTVEDWCSWITNTVLSSQLSRCFGRVRSATHPRPLRVGVFLNSEMFSGSEVYGLMMARALWRVGADVQVFIPRDSNYGRDSDGSRVNAWLARHLMTSAVRVAFQPGAGFLHLEAAEQSRQLTLLENEVSKLDIDIVFCSGFMPIFASLQLLGRALVMALFQPSAYAADDLFFLRGKLSGFVSDSAWSLAGHLKHLGGPGAVVKSILPVESTLGGQRADVRLSGAVRIALGGTLQPRKRQLQVIDAMRLLGNAGVDVRLNVYGYELEMLSDYVGLLRKRVSDWDLDETVTFHGLTSMDEIAAANDIVLTASIDESLPQTLADLMGYGLVGVACLSGGIDELIDDGNTGYLTSDTSAEGIAEVLSRAIADRGNWPRVTAAARAHLTTEFSEATNTTRLLRLLLESAQLESTRFGRLGGAP